MSDDGEPFSEPAKLLLLCSLLARDRIITNNAKSFLKELILRRDSRLAPLMAIFQKQQENRHIHSRLEDSSFLEALHEIICAESQGLYDELFSDSSLEVGKTLSKEERDRLNLTQEKSLIYGEVEYKSFYRVLRKINPEPGLTFYDLGSGTSKAVFVARLTQDFGKCVGIEILSSLHGQATKIVDRYNKRFKSLLAMGQNQHSAVYEGSLLDFDWSDGDVVFANSTCFDDDLMLSVSKLSERLQPGAIVITFTKGLSNTNTNYSKNHGKGSNKLIPAFELLERKRYKMSWGPATVFIHRRLRPDGQPVGPPGLNTLPSDEITYDDDLEQQQNSTTASAAASTSSFGSSRAQAGSYTSNGEDREDGDSGSKGAERLAKYPPHPRHEADGSNKGTGTVGATGYSSRYAESADSAMSGLTGFTMGTRGTAGTHMGSNSFGSSYDAVDIDTEEEEDDDEDDEDEEEANEESEEEEEEGEADEEDSEDEEEDEDDVDETGYMRESEGDDEGEDAEIGAAADVLASAGEAAAQTQRDREAFAQYDMEFAAIKQRYAALNLHTASSASSDAGAAARAGGGRSKMTGGGLLAGGPSTDGGDEREDEEEEEQEEEEEEEESAQERSFSLDELQSSLDDMNARMESQIRSISERILNNNKIIDAFHSHSRANTSPSSSSSPSSTLRREAQTETGSETRAPPPFPRQGKGQGKGVFTTQPGSQSNSSADNSRNSSRNPSAASTPLRPGAGAGTVFISSSSNGSGNGLNPYLSKFGTVGAEGPVKAGGATKPQSLTPKRPPTGSSRALPKAPNSAPSAALRRALNSGSATAGSSNFTGSTSGSQDSRDGAPSLSVPSPTTGVQDVSFLQMNSPLDSALLLRKRSNAAAHPHAATAANGNSRSGLGLGLGRGVAAGSGAGIAAAGTGNGVRPPRRAMPDSSDEN